MSHSSRPPIAALGLPVAALAALAVLLAGASATAAPQVELRPVNSLERPIEQRLWPKNKGPVSPSLVAARFAYALARDLAHGKAGRTIEDQAEGAGLIVSGDQDDRSTERAPPRRASGT